jgi:transposase
MGKPYSEDLRGAVVRSIEAGYTREEVAELYHVSLSSVGRFIKRWRATGSVSPEKFGGYKRHTLEGREQSIRRWIAERPDITLSELRARLAQENVAVSQSAVFRFLRHLKLTLKKSLARGRTGSARRRRGAEAVAPKTASA